MTAKSRGKLAPTDYRVLAEFRFLMRRFMMFSEDAARESGLAPQQHQALLAIKGFEKDEPPAVGDLAERLAIKHHSAVGLVDRLVKAGHLKRRHDDADRRRVMLSLTASGEKLLADLSAAHRHELRMLTPSLKALFAKLER
ncbi:MAG: winged helix-turn-helix transcriptional regulator [Proteobacteria bacterium]|nr:winged helix-turn-helix transcriptional regulator [Pseudomonadota bacterium]